LSGAASAATSSNWAGYAAHSTTYTSVKASWAQPTMTCAAGDSGAYAAFWVGIDGYSSASVEQAGTEADCDGTTAEYFAWYDLYPADPVYLSNTVKPGDSMTVTVSATTKDVFTLTIDDATQGWNHTAKATETGAARTSAEVIAEVSEPSQTLPAKNSVTFTNADVNGGTLGASNPTEINSAEVTCGSIINGTKFTCTWPN
jgi:hypothetical protein